MPSYNRVMLIGNVTRDPVLRHTASQTPVCNLVLAVNDRKKEGDKWVDKVDFIEVTLWNRQAEIAKDYLRKGSPVGIEAKLQQESREENGSWRSYIRVVAKKLILLEKQPADSGNKEASVANSVADEEVQF